MSHELQSRQVLAALAHERTLGFLNGGFVVGACGLLGFATYRLVTSCDRAKEFFKYGNEGGLTKQQCYARGIEAFGDSKAMAGGWFNLGVEGGGTVNGTHYSKLECYVKCLEGNNSFSSAWNNLGAEGGGMVAGQMYSKLQCFQKAVELDKANHMAWRNLANQGGGIISGRQYSKIECQQQASLHQSLHKQPGRTDAIRA